MKRIITSLSILLSSCAIISAANSNKIATDTTIIVTVSPKMHCVNCEKKIKSNIRFVKGVKNIVTNRDDQTVTIKADKNKFNQAELDRAFGKIGFKTSPVKK